MKKKKVRIEYGNGRTITIPQPENINIDFIGEPGRFGFDLAVDERELKNLGKALKVIKKRK